MDEENEIISIVHRFFLFQMYFFLIENLFSFTIEQSCISNDENCFCALLKVNTISILLDCPLNLSKILHFLPPTQMNKEKKRKLSEVDKRSSSSIKMENNHLFINGDVKYETPHFDVLEMDKIDVILISNFYNILALPYITEVK